MKWLKGDDSSPLQSRPPPANPPTRGALVQERPAADLRVFYIMLSLRAALFRPLSKTLDQWRRNPCY